MAAIDLNIVTECIWDLVSEYTWVNGRKACRYIPLLDILLRLLGIVQFEGYVS